MIEIRYCGSCGDYSLVENLSNKIEENLGISSSEIEQVECGACDMEIRVDDDTVFRETRDMFDTGAILEAVKQEYGLAV